MTRGLGIFFVFCLMTASVIGSSFANEFENLYNTIIQLDWAHSDDAEERRLYTNVVNLKKALDANTKLLEQNYQDIKANEQSLANRTLGAVSMAATGIGGMMLAQSVAEQQADEQAEQDMRAYLSSMQCEYGGGHVVKHGETNVELPGANELFNTYNEYVSLANDVKARKSSLGIKPGIESEVILDTSSLYDIGDTGGANGTYASLYRAMTDTTGDDAKQISERKSKTAQNLKTGAITAGAGVAIGMIGNLIINGGRATDKSAQLLQERENIMNDIQSVLNAKVTFCNNQVTRAKNLIQLIESNPELNAVADFREFVTAANNATTISDPSQLGGNPLCPK